MNRRNFFKAIVAIGAGLVAAKLPTSFAEEPSPIVSQKAIDQVEVRRRLLYVERVIRNAMESQIGEFNDSVTRSRVKQCVEEHVSRISNDFIVVCDETNNTPEIIDQMSLRVDITLNPKLDWEYLQIRDI